ncbi:MAG: DUF4347 domain-containing protein [Labilithrix sp.]|nr:DUF4347 domain-containing protein [Labilithrix sp.]MCW5812352.1 DUF4347 domain-containing protein [Labilithrix sp.]
MTALRLIVYDRTCTRWGVGLSTAWAAGARLYHRLDRHDAAYGATSWADALAWIASYEPSRSIAEVQYWGHGKWGRVLAGDDRLDRATFEGAHARAFASIRERLLPDGGSLLWLRTCEAFGGDAGHDFARCLADGLGARVAGHTFIIGVLQSGLRTLAPGMRPAWRATEGIAEGTPAKPLRAHESSALSPRTVHCLTNVVPRTWLAEDGVAQP